MTKRKSELQVQIEDIKRKATRVNPHVKELAMLSHKSDRASKEVRTKDGYVPRKRKENEALPQQYTTLWDKETYRTGMGDTVQAVRPGAMDFMKCKSRGIG